MRAEPGVHYGFDAPGVMRILLGAGALGLGLAVAAALALDGWLRGVAGFAGLAALGPLGLGCAMLAYGLAGKRRIRDLMIGRIAWRGDEQVLDIGTGRGLLLIAAAKRLSRGGHATGIDIWRTEDLSDNGPEALRRNIAGEGVEDRVTVRTADARHLPFPDESFDVVFSLFCIHNIDGEPAQAAALREVARVLRPGGRALIGEWLPTGRYAATLWDADLVIASCRSQAGQALSPMWIVEAAKAPRRPAAG